MRTAGPAVRPDDGGEGTGSPDTMRIDRTRIKICGLCSAADAAVAVAAGADAVGVVFADSPRQVTIDEAREVLSVVPPFVARVGVFVDAEAAFVRQAVERCGLTAVQLHGAEPPDFCDEVPVPVVKTIKVGTGFGWEAAEPYRGHVAALLLDTDSRKGSGGTGETFAWQLVTSTPEWAPVVVAGGLNPVNVGAAIKLLAPFAVDVSSGVEERPRCKDRHRVEAFISAVRAADEEVR